MLDGSRTSLFVLIAGLAVSGCQEVFRVGGNEYIVPETHLIPADTCCFFLPSRDYSEGGFSFYVNPEAELPDLHSVLIQERTEVCERARGRKARVNQTVCSNEQIEWKGRGWARAGDETWWTYAPRGGPEDAQFVSCTAMASSSLPNHPGLCTAVLPYGQSVLLIGLNGEDISEVELLYGQAVSLLREWEQ